MEFFESDIRIFHAFIKVAKKNKSFSDISIKSISEELGMSRQAMYQSHFKSIEEILNSLYFYVDKGIQKNITNILNKVYTRSDFIHEIVYSILPLIYEKREFFQILYSEKIESTWSHFMEHRYSDLLLPIFRDKYFNGEIISAEIQSRIIIHEFIGLISIWMNEEEPSSPEKFAPVVIYAMNKSAKDMINTYV